MKGQFLVSSKAPSIEPNIYADKSSLVLEWLLLKGVKEISFSIREVANDVGVSIGQVQKVFGVLILNGCLESLGLRTAKKFMIKKPQILLKNWLEHYNIVKKCKLHTYSTGFQGREQILNVLKKASLNQKVTLALHSAATALGYKSSNLESVELYLRDPDVRPQLEEVLQLEPQERGYEVLLIEPYYKSMLKRLLEDLNQQNLIISTPSLLTFLDLYNFPLRGREQAEFMAERIPSLKQIYKKGS